MSVPGARAGWRIGALAAVLLTVIAARPARAQDRDQRELAAKKACLGGHADKGIELLADLYTDTNDPTYIYNQGRCFEQNGRASEAITRFREYLRKATSLAPDERAQLQKHIDELEAEAKTGAAPAAVPTAAPAPSAVPPAQPAGVVSVSPSPAPERGRQLRLAAFITGGVGVLAIAGGAVMGLRARSLSNEVTDDANAGTFSQSKFDSGEHAQTLEYVGYGIAAAALITGGMLYYFSNHPGEHQDDHPGGTPTVGVAFDRSGAAATWRMAF